MEDRGVKPGKYMCGNYSAIDLMLIGDLELGLIPNFD
jgi:hypothetical protein